MRKTANLEQKPLHAACISNLPASCSSSCHPSSSGLSSSGPSSSGLSNPFPSSRPGAARLDGLSKPGAAAVPREHLVFPHHCVRNEGNSCPMDPMPTHAAKAHSLNLRHPSRPARLCLLPAGVRNILQSVVGGSTRLGVLTSRVQMTWTCLHSIPARATEPKCPRQRAQNSLVVPEPAMHPDSVFRCFLLTNYA